MSSDNHSLDARRVAIVGTGLLGASVGLALKAANFPGRIVGVARQQSTLDAALARHAVDEATTDLMQAVAGSDLVIVAVPLGGFEAVFEQLGRCLEPEAVVTDVGSSKLAVMEAARRHLPQPSRFVGSHPMAGNEQQGPDGAAADLFQGKPCIVTPEADTDPQALATVEQLWRMLGMKLVRTSAEEHDQQVAAISHLPHAMAALLVQVAAELGGWDIASTGFRDTTRVASGNPPMWADILMANRQPMLAALRTCRDQLDRLTAMIEAGDRDAILALLEDSRRRRDAWLGDDRLSTL